MKSGSVLDTFDNGRLALVTPNRISGLVHIFDVVERKYLGSHLLAPAGFQNCRFGREPHLLLVAEWTGGVSAWDLRDDSRVWHHLQLKKDENYSSLAYCPVQDWVFVMVAGRCGMILCGKTGAVIHRERGCYYTPSSAGDWALGIDFFNRHFRLLRYSDMREVKIGDIPRSASLSEYTSVSHQNYVCMVDQVGVKGIWVIGVESGMHLGEAEIVFLPCDPVPPLGIFPPAEELRFLYRSAGDGQRWNLARYRFGSGGQLELDDLELGHRQGLAGWVLEGSHYLTGDGTVVNPDDGSILYRNLFEEAPEYDPAMIAELTPQSPIDAALRAIMQEGLKE